MFCDTCDTDRVSLMPDAWLDTTEKKNCRELAAFNTLEMTAVATRRVAIEPWALRLTGFELDSSHECAART